MVELEMMEVWIKVVMGQGKTQICQIFILEVELIGIEEGWIVGFQGEKYDRFFINMWLYCIWGERGKRRFFRFLVFITGRKGIVVF